MEDFKTRGGDVDAQYMKVLAEKKRKVITAIEVTNIVANFDKVGEKKLGYEVCMKNNLLQFI